MDVREQEVRAALERRLGKHMVTGELVELTMAGLEAEAAGRAIPAQEQGIVITTKCIVCATYARMKNSPFYAGRGVDWPVTQIAGQWVHVCCSDDVTRRIADIEDGSLVIDAHGVGRWASNGHVIPEECAVMFAVLGLAPELDVDATAEARDVETAKFLRAYRENPPQPDAEQLAEMRAAFGPGATVVDVVTGQRTRL